MLAHSEWHSVISCPVGDACRQRFHVALSIFRNISESPEVLEGSFSAIDQKEILEIPSKCSSLRIFSDRACLIILCRSESQIASKFGSQFSGSDCQQEKGVR